MGLHSLTNGMLATSLMGTIDAVMTVHGLTRAMLTSGNATALLTLVNRLGL